MVYRDFTDLSRRTASENILRSKAFHVAKKPTFYGYEGGVALMVYKSFDKKTSATRTWSETLATKNKFLNSGITNENIANRELAEELHKPIMGKLKKRKLNSPFIENISGSNPADIRLISTFNKVICFFIMRYLYFKSIRMGYIP